MKKLVLLAVLVLFSVQLSYAEKLYNRAPALLPHTSREMKTAGFWISRHPSPDQVVLTPEEISAFNSQIQSELKLTQDLKQFKTSSKELIVSFNLLLDEFSKRGLFLEDGNKAKAAFFDEMKTNMSLESLNTEINPQYGLIVHFADQLFFPTEKGLYAEAGDIDFDELQNSDLDVGTPVIVLHKSKDGQWLYVQSEISFGWVKADKVAICTAEEFDEFVSAQGIIVRAKADIYLDVALIDYYDYVRMGARLPVSNVIKAAQLTITDIYCTLVTIPMRNEDGTAKLLAGYIKVSDINKGYLPYKARTIINQAFELLNEPYGWGGMYGEQDCSRFLQEIFATVGIFLPRDSKDQKKVGRFLAEFNEDTPSEKKLAVLAEALGDITVLPMRGHIMLYLGMVDNRPYAIHAVWAYREKVGKEDHVRVINRVAVSDLFLGEGSKKGSLLQRLSSVKVIAK